MKFGIIGGIGPASTVDYYSGIIAKCLKAGKTYPQLVIDSIDMNEMCGYFEKEDYSNALSMLVSAVYNLKNAGAPSRCYVESVRDGVKIRVVIEPSTGKIITGFPVQ